MAERDGIHSSHDDTSVLSDEELIAEVQKIKEHGYGEVIVKIAYGQIKQVLATVSLRK